MGLANEILTFQVLNARKQLYVLFYERECVCVLSQLLFRHKCASDRFYLFRFDYWVPITVLIFQALLTTLEVIQLMSRCV